MLKLQNEYAYNNSTDQYDYQSHRPHNLSNDTDYHSDSTILIFKLGCDMGHRFIYYNNYYLVFCRVVQGELDISRRTLNHNI